MPRKSKTSASFVRYRVHLSRLSQELEMIAMPRDWKHRQIKIVRELIDTLWNLDMEKETVKEEGDSQCNMGGSVIFNPRPSEER